MLVDLLCPLLGFWLAILFSDLKQPEFLTQFRIGVIENLVFNWKQKKDIKKRDQINLEGEL